MTADALLVVQTLFGVIWRLFTSWKIPGTDTTPAGWFLFVALAVLTLKFLKSVIPGWSPQAREPDQSALPPGRL